MELLWRDLLHNPQILSPQFTGKQHHPQSSVPFASVHVPGCGPPDVCSHLCCGPGVLQLLTARTSRKFLACRLTPDMETKLLFMTSRVKPVDLCLSLGLHLCRRHLHLDLCLCLRSGLGSRSGIKTGFSASTCPQQRANRYAVI